MPLSRKRPTGCASILTRSVSGSDAASFPELTTPLLARGLERSQGGAFPWPLSRPLRRGAPPSPLRPPRASGDGLNRLAELSSPSSDNGLPDPERRNGGGACRSAPMRWKAAPRPAHFRTRFLKATINALRRVHLGLQCEH